MKQCVIHKSKDFVVNSYGNGTFYEIIHNGMLVFLQESQDVRTFELLLETLDISKIWDICEYDLIAQPVDKTVALT